MQARNARARREFLYRKALEGKDREEYERRQKLKRLIENGDKIPKDLRADEAQMRREMALVGSKEVSSFLFLFFFFFSFLFSGE